MQISRESRVSGPRSESNHPRYRFIASRRSSGRHLFSVLLPGHRRKFEKASSSSHLHLSKEGRLPAFAALSLTQAICPPPCRVNGESPDSNSTNAIDFHRRVQRNTFPSSRCASAIQIVRPLESIARHAQTPTGFYAIRRSYVI